MSTILETRGLTHVYGAGTPFERVALDHVDLKIEKGEILGVIGHTGSGKSTLIQHLNGLLQPTSGSVLIDGQAPAPTRTASSAICPTKLSQRCDEGQRLISFFADFTRILTA